MADVLEPELNLLGFKTERVTVPKEKIAEIPWELKGERINLIGHLNSGMPKASVYGHIDVVPCEDNWTKDPFGGEIENGKLYGRGTVDMKGSIASFLGAVKVIKDLGLNIKYDLDCMFCTDEEIGVYPGARWLAEKGYFSEHIIWLEGAVADFPAIVLGTSGAVRIELTGYGKSCHSGSNYLGVNAVEEMVPVLEELIKLKRDVEKRTSRLNAFPMPGAPSDKLTPMFNINIIKGGKGVNVVPDECRLTIDRRYLPDENYEDVMAEIIAAFEAGKSRSKLLDLKWKVAHSYRPTELDKDSPAMVRARAARKAVHGWDDYIYGAVSMSTDMGFVIDALKPAVADITQFGVDRGFEIRSHITDEFVYVADLVSVAKELIYYLCAD
jgi:succinyl-diaminopimelate desuccinylase